ncbi:MAG: ADP-ribosylglycohydrolase family protein [Acidobacteriota bacterium]
MKRVLMIVALLGLVSCAGNSDSHMRSLTADQLRDKIAGGWAGKMIGVSYGAPTEFRAMGETYEKELTWSPERLENAIQQDDLYVQLSFMMAMDKYGIDAPAEKLAESFATAGYPLWHANVMARKNFFDGILPPLSGNPQFNLHADDIDFQIEADYIGFMCPGMPRTAVEIADRVGHIMNYGDGVYGGMFVDALYAEAFFSLDIPAVVNRALLSIPSQSDYAACIRDVVALHAAYPDDWRRAWRELEARWGAVDICGALVPFNIDAKLNGAYIVMGLLYGGGDFQKTMEVSIRSGQDSDCNPSNAAAVLGVMRGLSGIPEEWKKGIAEIADSKFIFTDYTFKSAVDNTVRYARELIRRNGGEVTQAGVRVAVQEPQAPAFEDAFPDVVPDYRSSVFEPDRWRFEGSWQIGRDRDARGAESDPQSYSSSVPGSAAEFVFNGTGVVIRGNWMKDGGLADFYLDGRLDRTVNTYFHWAGQEKRDNFLWHVLHLDPGPHTVRVVVSGEKKPESEGARIYLTGATVFKTGLKQNCQVALSVER